MCTVSVPNISSGDIVQYQGNSYRVQYTVFRRPGIMLKLDGVEDLVRLEKVTPTYRTIHLTRVCN